MVKVDKRLVPLILLGSTHYGYKYIRENQTKAMENYIWPFAFNSLLPFFLNVLRHDNALELFHFAGSFDYFPQVYKEISYNKYESFFCGQPIIN